MNEPIKYSLLDQLCLNIDQGLRSIFGHPVTSRANPGNHEIETHLSVTERKKIAGFMRVNHCGEVCAQALYQAQALASRNKIIKAKMQHAATEENDHLAWCKTRLIELGSHTSYLNPCWYAGSFVLGLAAGLMGDSWSLGFLAETEKQVVQHLQKNIECIPSYDTKTQVILQQMQQDESAHQQEAIAAGAKELPEIIKTMMRMASKIMVKVSYWV